MSEAPDLNALLQGIKQADTDLKLAREDLMAAQATYGLREGALAVAQKAFDDAVLAARGEPLPIRYLAMEPAKPVATEPVPDTRNLGPQGPLPPTSPALRLSQATPYPEDDDRPEKVGA